MPSIAIKAVSVLTLAAGSILGGYGISKYNKKVSVEESLTTEEKSRLLDTTKIENENTSSHDYEAWKTITTNSSTLEDLKKFISDNSTSEEKDTINKTKTKCQESKGITSDKESFQDTLSAFKKFCLRKS